MSQFALDRVISVAGNYVKDNSIAFIADQITDPTLSFTSELEDVVDARGNVVMQLQGARGATFGASNAFFNTQILAAQTGGKIKDEAVEFTKYDIVALDKDKKGVLTAEPKGTAAADFTVYKLEKDNSFTTATALTATTDYTYATKAITVVNEAAKEGDKYLVVYQASVTGEHIVAKADATNELMNVTAEVLLRELCDESLCFAYIIMRGKMSGEAEWSMTRDGNHGFEITAMPAYCDADKKLVEVVIVKE